MGVALLKTFVAFQLLLLLLVSVDAASTRKRVVVEGVVYCKSCKYSGEDTLTNATPVLGAEVKLACNTTKHQTKTKTATATTDKNGYFFLQAPAKMVSSYGSRNCKMYLVSSPSVLCNKATDLNKGISGATLYFEKTKSTNLTYALNSAGPFAFEPLKC